MLGSRACGGEVSVGLRVSGPVLVAWLMELDAAGALTRAYVRAGAQASGVSVRTVWRWLEAARSEGRVERRPRARLELSGRAWEVLAQAGQLADLGFTVAAEQTLLRAFYPYALPEGGAYELIAELHTGRGADADARRWREAKAQAASPLHARTDQRARADHSPRHTPTRPARRHPSRVPTRRLTSGPSAHSTASVSSKSAPGTAWKPRSISPGIPVPRLHARWAADPLLADHRRWKACFCLSG